MSERLLSLTVAAAAFIVVALFATTGVAERAEQPTIDARLALRADRAANGVAVVAIDDRTFSVLRTQWPLPRGLHARAIDALRRAGARHIVYDVQFTEPGPSPRQDNELFRAVARARDVVLATAESDARGRTRVLGGDARLAPTGAVAAAGTLPVEEGSVVRRYRQQAGLLDTIPVAVASRLGRPLDAGDFDDGQALIDFRGPAGTVPKHSFVDLIEGRVAPEALRDRIVVVGPTTPTVRGRQRTSAGGDALMSVPEIHANAILTALRGNPLREAPGWVLWLLLLGFTAAGALLVGWLGPVRGAAAAVVAALAYMAAAHLAFAQDLVLPVFAPLFALLLVTVACVIAAAARERTARRAETVRGDELEARVAARTRELEITHLEAVERLAAAAELRDVDTGDHIARMSRLCELVALELGDRPDAARLLRQAAALHDVGKIGLPDNILRKPGKLTPEEVEVMRRHTTIGAELLRGSQSPLMRLAEEIALTHHERWDGTGYPAGLEADEIPHCGRIAAVCDVYDALISTRPYKRAWTAEEATAEIAAQRGRHFEPAVADALLAVVARETQTSARPAITRANAPAVTNMNEL